MIVTDVDTSIPAQISAKRRRMLRAMAFLTVASLMIFLVALSIADSGVAVMTILHDLNLAAAHADELVVMRAGKIVASGEPAHVLAGGLFADVFGVDLRLCATPPGNAPFILPHGHARRIAWRRPVASARSQSHFPPASDGVNKQRSKPCATLPRNENVSMSFCFWP